MKEYESIQKLVEQTFFLIATHIRTGFRYIYVDIYI